MKTTFFARRMPRLVALCALPAFAATAAAGIGNDSCATPQSISGNGTFPFDNNAATTGSEGQRNQNCVSPDGVTGIENDEWFCWTATCTGLVEISTCGLTQVDTKIAFYRECVCPTDDRPALCCNDDACGRQSTIRCEVECGRRYMIQIGKRPGTPSGAGSFRVTCVGEDCGHCPPPECCGAKPVYTDPAYSTFTGQVMAMTAEVFYPASLSTFALTVFDIKDHGTAPLNSNWNPPNFRYNDPRWTKGNLGSLFGVTLDDRGNIYAAHGTCYNGSDPIGAWAGSTAGSIYQIATGSGTPSVFANLPNNGPGIGNVAWDCQYSQIFASNFEDGRIYRIRADGTFLSAFDHASGVVTPGVAGVIANEPGEPDGQFARLGERVWAVKKAGDRLYYSVWSRDSRNINNSSDPRPPNQVWSIQLDGAGDFIAGTVVLELTMPGYGANLYSEPVSDISFSPDTPARMLCAERNMTSDTGSYAHDARLLEFECAGGAWSLSSANTNVNGPSYGLPVGDFFDDANSAGGCDYDTEPNGRIWVTGDALHYLPGDYIYGGAGILRAGASSATDILYDYNNDVTGSDKSQLGDVAIPCRGAACATVSDVSIRCEGSFYSINLNVTNNTASTIHYLLLPNAPTTPHVVTLSPPLAPGDTGNVTITLTGVSSGTSYCFDMILADREVDSCCHTRVCVDIPRCDCVELERVHIDCDASTGLPTLTISFINLRPEVLEHMFLIPLPPHAGATVSPDYVPLGGLPPGGGFTTPPISISGANPGDTFCVRLTFHEEHMMECCSVVVCVTIPPPCSGAACPPDFNHDGELNTTDFFAYTGAFLAGDMAADYDENTLLNTEDFFRYMADFLSACD